MKFTIDGFSQQRAIELNLTAEDLVVLRWFVDFWPSPKMIKMEHNGKQYGLVSYKGFIEQMPIIGCNKRTIARKFQRLVDSEVLENATIKQGGSFSVYRFGKQYDTLVQKCTTVDNEQHTVVENSTDGLYNNDQPGMYNNQHTKTNPYNSNLPTNNSSNKTVDKKKVRHKYGEYKNVLLSDEDMEKLKKEFPNDWQDRIENLSSYVESTGKTYKNHLATIRNWARKEKPNGDNGKSGGYHEETESYGIIL